jgi:hypothetical protein
VPALRATRLGPSAKEFVSVQALDFRLGFEQNPGMNVGIVIRGINNGVKDRQPDLGAYEFGSVLRKAGSSLTPAK